MRPKDKVTVIGPVASTKTVRASTFHFPASGQLGKTGVIQSVEGERAVVILDGETRPRNFLTTNLKAVY